MIFLSSIRLLCDEKGRAIDMSRFVGALGSVTSLFEMEAIPAISQLSTEGLYVWKDVPYRKTVDYEEEGSFGKNMLDIYIPKGAFPRPLLPVCLFVHGGSWRRGDRDHMFGLYGNVGVACARAGCVGVVMSYRLAPSFPHPAQVQDVARALVWVRRNIETYGGCRDRVVVAGHSAGAHLGLLALTQSRWTHEAWEEAEAGAGAHFQADASSTTIFNRHNNSAAAAATASAPTAITAAMSPAPAPSSSPSPPLPSPHPRHPPPAPGTPLSAVPHHPPPPPLWGASY